MCLWICAVLGLYRWPRSLEQIARQEAFQAYNAALCVQSIWFGQLWRSKHHRKLSLVVLVQWVFWWWFIVAFYHLSPQLHHGAAPRNFLQWQTASENGADLKGQYAVIRTNGSPIILGFRLPTQAARAIWCTSTCVRILCGVEIRSWEVNMTLWSSATKQ